MGKQVRAIIWAQWRTLRNYLPRSNKFTFWLTGLFGLVWYGGFAFLATLRASFSPKRMSSPLSTPFFQLRYCSVFFIGSSSQC